MRKRKSERRNSKGQKNRTEKVNHGGSQKKQNRTNQEKSGATRSGERKHERDNRCPHWDPLNPNSHRGRTDPRHGPWEFIYWMIPKLNTKQLQGTVQQKIITHLGTQQEHNSIENIIKTQEKRVKSMPVFTGLETLKKHVYEHIRFRIIACWWRRGESIWQRKIIAEGHHYFHLNNTVKPQLSPFCHFPIFSSTVVKKKNHHSIQHSMKTRG